MVWRAAGGGLADDGVRRREAWIFLDGTEKTQHKGDEIQGAGSGPGSIEKAGYPLLAPSRAVCYQQTVHWPETVVSTGQLNERSVGACDDETGVRYGSLASKYSGLLGGECEAFDGTCLMWTASATSKGA